MGLKIAVIGAGSTYTPELIEGLTDPSASLPIDELALEDTQPQRLAIVGGLARRMAARRDWAGALRMTSDLDDAVEGANFVLVQLRVGGQEARILDETIPLQFGTIGQETTGAGGFSKALRTVPVVLDIAERTARRASPAAWVVNFTNPVGIVTQALLDAGHRAVGLCNIGVTLERRVAGALGVAAESVVLEHVGLNHLTWERGVRVDGVERLPELLDVHADAWASEAGLTPRALRELGALPSSYLRYFNAFETVLAEQRAAPSRGAAVLDIERELLAQYADPSLVTRPALLDRRGGAYYSDAAARLVGSLHAGGGRPQVVDVRNAGTVPGMGHDDVVEVSAPVGPDGPRPDRQAPLPPELLDLMRRVKAYERSTIRAALGGSREDARRALEAHPLVGPKVGDVVPLLDALLAAQARHLPRFAGGRGA